MITPYSVLATSVGISLFLSLVEVESCESSAAELSNPATTSLFDGPDRARLVGVDPKPGPGLHQPLQPGADKLRPCAGHGPGHLGIHHADGPEGEPNQGADSRLGQVEGGHADAHAHME